MNALGFVAGTLTTLAFLPQVMRSYRARSAAHFSWGWLVLFAGGVAAWTGYGVLRDDVAIIWPNGVTLLLVLSLILLRVRGAGEVPAHTSVGAPAPSTPRER